MSLGATEEPAGAISPMSGVGESSDGKNEWAAISANAEPDAERPPHLFKPGQSGNPAGKKPGTRNRATKALEELLDGEAEGLTRKVVELALAGDMGALRICMDRLLPPRKDRPIRFEMPPIDSAADARAVSAALLAAVSAGNLTPGEAAEVSKLIDAYLKAIEVTEILARLEKLEQQKP
jgi:Family of unknown function (DUF5681)